MYNPVDLFFYHETQTPVLSWRKDFMIGGTNSIPFSCDLDDIFGLILDAWRKVFGPV